MLWLVCWMMPSDNYQWTWICWILTAADVVSIQLYAFSFYCWAVTCILYSFCTTLSSVESYALISPLYCPCLCTSQSCICSLPCNSLSYIYVPSCLSCQNIISSCLLNVKCTSTVCDQDNPYFNYCRRTF